MNTIFKNTNLKIKVLTPTHIGMGQEKDLIENIDFINQNGNVYIINKTNLFKPLDAAKISELSELLLYGSSLEDFIIKNRHLYEKIDGGIFLKTIKSKALASPNLIKSQYSNGIGQHFLLGSSIKGAIRSILYEKFKRIDHKLDETAIFGTIDANLMNLITVADVAVGDECINIYPTKVYSADGKPSDGIGQWKHHNNKKNSDPKHTEKFKPFGFVSYYQAITPDFQAELRIGLKDIANTKWLNKIPNNNLLFESPIEELISLIKEHTKRYLDKEKEYYTKFSNPYLGSQAFKILKKMSEENEKPNSCVLRVGANVGYHSITGDWKFDNHVDGWGYNPQSGCNQIQAKTRKFTFEKNDDLDTFQPMGFIKLSIPEKEVFKLGYSEQLKAEPKKPNVMVSSKSLKHFSKKK